MRKYPLDNLAILTVLALGFFLGQQALATPATSSAANDNVLAITVGGSNATPNLAVVSVLICPPGEADTSACVTIPNVQLDTGSIGLRLFSEAPGFDSRGAPVASSIWHSFLKPSLDSAAQALTECYAYGGGDKFWGPVQIGHVVFGHARASDLSIQIVDPTKGQPSGDCASVAGHPRLSADEIHKQGISGVLGINATSASDCEDVNCIRQLHIDPQYFSCESHQCHRVDSMPMSATVANPISHLPEDLNNGYVLAFRAVGAAGSFHASGTLTFGLGTRANNTPTEPGNLKFIDLDRNGWFNLNFQGHSYPSLFDTGTVLYYLPSGIQSLSPCQTSGYWHDGLCANPDQSFGISISDANGLHPFPGTISVGESDKLYGSGSLGLNNAALLASEISKNGGQTYALFILGMPFLYGKTIYSNLRGHQALGHQGAFSALLSP